MKHRISSRRTHPPAAGIVLFEVMLAVVIVGLALTGFVVVLQELISASTAANHDAQLRLALQSRLAEIKTEHLVSGRSRYEYADGKVLLEQTVEAAALRDDKGMPLSGIYEVTFRVSPKQGTWPPMEGKFLTYQP